MRHRTRERVVSIRSGPTFSRRYSRSYPRPHHSGFPSLDVVLSTPCGSDRAPTAMLFLIFHIVWVATVSARCYEPNVAHPLPVYEAASDDILKAAFARINTALTKALNDPKHVNTSFSIEVTSSKESLWSTHHTAQERNSSRPDVPQVNGDALYRIASITKTFTVLGVLYQHAAGNLSLDDPINTYIEELRDGHEGSIPWKDITLRSLASQLSGIPRECRLRDRQCYTYEGIVADSWSSCSSRPDQSALLFSLHPRAAGISARFAERLAQVRRIW